jgi:DNA repair ATPase RecN
MRAVPQSVQGNVLSEMRQKILEKIRRLETQMAGRMDEHRRFMDRFIDEGDHTAKERADQVMRIWHRHRNEIAELKEKLTKLD